MLLLSCIWNATMFVRSCCHLHKEVILIDNFSQSLSLSEKASYSNRSSLKNKLRYSQSFCWSILTRSILGIEMDIIRKTKRIAIVSFSA